ncbi:MAG: LPS export ABC transporter permease LptG [Burkholderiales bacterium]|jgi:lipopolysaccharide export system permease protein|nr:LPS export ABC transporter permease LptG [Burkholderiales bacterium]
MKTVRRLFYVDVVSSVAFVAVAFLSLFFFIDFVDELSDAGKRGYTAFYAGLVSALELPGHVYELMPIAVLIGTIYALSRLAQSSEFTILRTGGLGPGRALSLLTTLGFAFAVLTFIVGDYLAPFAEEQAAHLQASFKGGLKLGRGGAWLKDRQLTPKGERSYSINVGSATAGGKLQDIRIFEFDSNGRMVERIAAATGEVDKHAQWRLSNVTITQWADPTADQLPMASEQKLPSLLWHSTLSANVVAAAVLPLSTMSTIELSRYITHLADNEQAAQQYEIQFWKRALYPFACLVMVGLALPFAYLHARGGGVSLKVFGGIMLGISFVLLNNVAGHLGMLRNWTPWIVAATPSAIYLMLSMAAFTWLVRYR